MINLSLMSKEMPDNIRPLSCPLVYTGQYILECSAKRLHNLKSEQDKLERLGQTISEENIQLMKWLGRLENALVKHYIYSVTIDEAVKLGIIL